MSGFSFSPPSSSSSSSTHHFSPFSSSSSSSYSVFSSISPPSSFPYFGFSLGNPSSSNPSPSSSSPSHFSLSFNSSSSTTPSLFDLTPSSSASFGFGLSIFKDSSSSGLTTTSNLFGSPSSSCVSTTSTTVFGSSSSSSVSTGTIAAPFSSNLFGSSSSAAPSFPNLFGAPSSPFSTTVTPAAFSFPPTAFPAFGVSSSSSSAASTATATTVSSATTASSTTNTAASSGTTSSFPGFSLSTKTSAAASSGQPQSTDVAPLFGPPFPIDGSCSGCSAMFVKVDLGDREDDVDGVEEVNAECGQGRDDLAKQVTVSMVEQKPVVPGLRTDQEESKKVMKMEVSSVQESVVSTVISATSFVPVEVATNPSVVSISANSMSKSLPAEAIVVNTNAPEAELNVAGSAKVTYPGKEVQLGQEDAPICVENLEMKVEGISDVTSTITTEDEASPHEVGTGSQTFCVSAPFIYVNGYCISSQNGLIVKQIFDKYGDITKGSRIKSVAAKSGFLELVADAVQRLCNHTMKTLSLDELRFIEQHTADALAVGFHVNWLHQRVEKIISASDYYLHLMELDKLAKQIDDVKKSLMEMELRQIICMQEIAAIKGEMEEHGFGESNLGEGLL